MSDAQHPDAFAAVTNLIALVSDPKACARRLDELQKLEGQIAGAQAQLAADREQHDRRAAELDTREASLLTREEACAAAEAEYFSKQEPEKYPLGANGERGTRSHSGLVRS
jgi:hypothetical protein